MLQMDDAGYLFPPSIGGARRTGFFSFGAVLYNFEAKKQGEKKETMNWEKGGNMD